jgi:hypothetical protein
MLRYATFIQPPSIRTRDEHILATLLSLLREPSSSSSSRSSSGGGGSSNDHKLRKRVTAAFGEIVFYITAQEDDLNNKEFNANLGNTNAQIDSGILIDNNNGEIQDKWILPNNITETLLKCLKEESDEVVKHYIIKTIENILSQGGIYYKKRITNLEIGQILLEVSLTSHNESLQGTAAMAVVHMMILVFNAPFESAGLSETTSFKKNVKTSPSRSSSNNSNINNNSIDPFTSPSLQTSAKFIFKLFEKMNFVSFLEVIKDGQIKLQQAFLNFFNVLLLFPFNHLSHSFLPFIEAIDFLFNNPATGNNSPVSGIAALTSPTKGQLNNNNSSLLTTANNFYSSPVFQQYLSEGVQRIGLLGGLSANGTVQTIVNQFCSSYQSLSSIRNFFLKSSNSSLVLNLFKLIEQSPINIIRAKALLAYQLLCSHNLSFLSQLSERRLPAVLVRIIEPLIDQYDQFVTNLAGKKERGINEQNTKNNTKTTAENPAIQSNYLLKNCLSFLLFLKLSKMKCMKQIAQLLEELSTLPVEMISSANNNTNTTAATPGSGGLYGTPKNHSSSDRSPMVTLHGKSPASPKVKGGATPASPAKQSSQQQSDLKTRQAQQEKLLFICRQLKYYSDILRAIITVISQPTLSRLLLAGQEIFLLELTNALRILPLVRTSLLSSHQTAGGFNSPPPRGGMNARTNQNNQNEILEALVLTEQACLAALESIAQVEIPENIDVFLSLPSSAAGSTILFETHSIPSDSLMNLLVPFQPNWLQWIKIVLFYLLPVINKLLTHPDGDIRVVVSSFIRKIVPFYYKCYCQYFILPPTTTTITTTNNNPMQSKQSQHGESFPSSNPSTANGMIPINPLLSFLSPRNVSIGFHNRFEEMNYLIKLSFHYNPTILMDSLQGILSVSSSLLTEQAPIPQYIIRFLNDIFELFISSYRSSSSFLQQNQQSQQPPKGPGQQPQIVVYQQQLHNFAHILIQEIISVLKSSGTINVIIHLLKSTSTQLQQQNNNNNNYYNNNPASDKDSEGDGSSLSNNPNNNNNNLSNSLDPQLLFLLRNLFEFNKETASLLLESDIGGSLSIAIIASVYHNIRFPFVHNAAIGSSSLINFDLLIPLMDLLHLILHSVLREISGASQQQQQQQQPQQTGVVQRAEQHKKLINPLKAVTPALLLVIAYVDSYLLEARKAKQQRDEDEEEEDEEDPQEHLIKLHLLETSTRCLGILFDLFSDTITNQLIAKQSILLDNNNNNNNNNNSNNSSNNNSLTPRTVFAKLIRNRQVIELCYCCCSPVSTHLSSLFLFVQVENKVVLKILKILFGVIKVTSCFFFLLS